MAIGSSDGQYFNDEAEHFLVSRGIKPVISDQKLAGQGQFKDQSRVKTQDRLPQTDNPFNLKKEPPEDRRLLDPTPLSKKADQDLDRPLGSPNRTLRPPILPGAKGEYLTS